MKKILGLMLLSACAFPAWADHDYDDRHLNGYELGFESPSSRHIEVMSSHSYDTSGSQSDIIGRAQVCVEKHVSNAPNASTGVLGIIGAKGQHSSSSDATEPVVESADSDSGKLQAHARAPYRHLLLSYEARSRLSVEAQDGHFRIVQTDLAYRQLDTGTDAQQDFSPIQRLAITGWDDALEALQEVSDRVASCIKG